MHSQSLRIMDVVIAKLWHKQKCKCIDVGVRPGGSMAFPIRCNAEIEFMVSVATFLMSRLNSSITGGVLIN